MSDDNTIAELQSQLRAALNKISQLETEQQGFGQALDSIESALAGSADQLEQQAADAGDEEQHDPVDLHRPDLALLIPWVEDNIGRWYKRRLSKTGVGTAVLWCRQWHRHPEVVTRLWTLRAEQMEAAAEGPAAVGRYLREAFDYQLGVITSAGGPFEGCDPTKPDGTGHKPDDVVYLPTLRPDDLGA